MAIINTYAEVYDTMVSFTAGVSKLCPTGDSQLQQRPYVEQSQNYVPSGPFRSFANPSTQLTLIPRTTYQEAASRFDGHLDFSLNKDLGFLSEYFLQRIATYWGKGEGAGNYKEEG